MADDADALLAQMDAKFVEDMGILDGQLESAFTDRLSQEAALRKEFSDSVLKRIEKPMEELHVGNDGNGSPAAGTEAAQKPA